MNAALCLIDRFLGVSQAGSGIRPILGSLVKGMQRQRIANGLPAGTARMLGLTVHRRFSPAPKR